MTQDYSNIEVQVVNDGGVSIKKLVDDLNMPFPCHVTELIENHGRSYSGNLGLEKANGDYLCFIDDDDLFYPFHVSTLIDAIKRTNYQVVYSDAVQASQVRCPYNDKMYSTVDLSLVLSEDFSLNRFSLY